MADSVLVRSFIGLGLIVAIVGLMAVDHVTGHAWGVIVLGVILVAAGLREYAAMAGALGPIPTRFLILSGSAYVALKGVAYELGDPRLHGLTTPLAIAAAYALFFACLRGAPSKDRFAGLTAAVFGFFYLPFLGGFALDVRYLSPAGEPAYFYVIAIAKGTDICAYFAGKSLGRRKVVPSVSPGKTVAGFVGAVVGAIGITWLFVVTTDMGKLVPLPLVPGVGIVMALVVISGDLIESFIKRSVETKDSANLVPQFGGVLDIIDSVVIVAPVVFFMLLILKAYA